MYEAYNMARKKSIPKRFVKSKKSRSKSPPPRLQKIENALLVALRLLKTPKERVLPKAHFGYELNEKKGEKDSS